MFDWLRSDSARMVCNLGEVNGIGATALVIRVCGKTGVIDWGVAISRNGDYQTKSVPAGNYLLSEHIDWILISHDHLDHIGAILRLIRHHPEAIVFILRSALDAFETMSEDSIKIMLTEGEEAIRRCVSPPEMIFDWDDLKNFMAIARSEDPEAKGVYVIDEPSWLEWPDSPEWQGWRFKFYSSGHDRGATSLSFRTSDGQVFFHTSDIASHTQDPEYISGVMLADNEFWDGDLDNPNKVMITEATNGARNEITWSHGKTVNTVASRDDLDSVYEIILSETKTRGGIALVATFAKNRGSVLTLKAIRMGHKVAIDGLLRKIIRDELGNSKVDQLIADNKLLIVDYDKEKGQSQREALVRGDYGFVVIVAPSATLDKGKVVFYAEHLLPDHKNTLIIPGHIFPDSTAKEIMNIERGRTIKLNCFVQSKKGFVIKPVLVNVRCEVYHLDYTSHDKQTALVQRVKLFHPNILVVHHCDDQAFEEYVKALRIALDYPLRIERATHLREINLN